LVGLVFGCTTSSTDSSGAPSQSTLAQDEAVFSVDNLLVEPEEVLIGDSIKVTATVNNSGKAEGVYSAVLKLDDKELDRRDIAVDHDSAEVIVFEVKCPETAGEFRISIGESTGTLIVKALKEYTIKYDSGEAGMSYPSRKNQNLIIYYKPPSVPFRIQNLQVYGTVDCAPSDLVNTTFRIVLWNQDRSKQLWEKEFPYSLFDTRPQHKWVDLEVDDIEVTEGFLVEFDLTNRKCDLFMTMAKVTSGTDIELYKWAVVNLDGTLCTEFPYTNKGDWMVRIQGIAP
jgi:hypothetical protein